MMSLASSRPIFNERVSAYIVWSSQLVTNGSLVTIRNLRGQRKKEGIQTCLRHTGVTHAQNRWCEPAPAETTGGSGTHADQLSCAGCPGPGRRYLVRLRDSHARRRGNAPLQRVAKGSGRHQPANVDGHAAW